MTTGIGKAWEEDGGYDSDVNTQEGTCDNSADLNRQTANRIANKQSLHKEAQEILAESIFTELQIAQSGGRIKAGLLQQVPTESEE